MYRQDITVKYINKNSYRYLIMLLKDKKAHCYNSIRSGKSIGLAISQFLQNYHSYDQVTTKLKRKRKNTKSLQYLKYYKASSSSSSSSSLHSHRNKKIKTNITINKH